MPTELTAEDMVLRDAGVAAGVAAGAVEEYQGTERVGNRLAGEEVDPAAGMPAAIANLPKNRITRGVLEGDYNILESAQLAGGWTPDSEINKQIETIFDAELSEIAGDKPKVVILAESDINDLIYRTSGDILDKSSTQFTNQAYDFKKNNPQFDVQIISGYGRSQMEAGLGRLKSSGFVDEETSVMFMGHHDDNAKYFGIPPDELSQVFRDSGLYNEFKDVYLGSCRMGDNPWGCANISFAVGDQTPVYAQRDMSWGESSTYAGYRKGGGDYPYKYDPSMEGSAFSVGADVAMYSGFDVEGDMRIPKLTPWGARQLKLHTGETFDYEGPTLGLYEHIARSQSRTADPISKRDFQKFMPEVKERVIAHNPLWQPAWGDVTVDNTDINELIVVSAKKFLHNGKQYNFDSEAHKKKAGYPTETKDGKLNMDNILHLLNREKGPGGDAVDEYADRETLHTSWERQFGQFIRSGDPEIEIAMNQAYKNLQYNLEKYDIDPNEARTFVAWEALKILQESRVEDE